MIFILDEKCTLGEMLGVFFLFDDFYFLTAFVTIFICEGDDVCATYKFKFKLK
jgi:hypothetical protein